MLEKRVENYLISTQFVHRERGEPHRCSLLKTKKKDQQVIR